MRLFVDADGSCPFWWSCALLWAGFWLPMELFAQPDFAEESEQSSQDSNDEERIEEVVIEGVVVDRDKYGVRELKAIAGTGGDPLKALDIIPGVISPVDDGGPPGGEGFYVRGSDLTDNLIQLDRQTLGYLFHLGPDVVSIINPALVKAFDIDLNAFSISNPDRLGGVISAQLRQPATDRTRRQYRVSFLDAGFLVEGPLSERDSYWVAGRRSYFDLIVPSLGLDAFDEEEDEGEDARIIQFPSFYDVQGRWHRQLDNGFMDATFIQAQDRITVELLNVEGRDPALTGRLSANLQFSTLQYRWHLDLSDRLRQQLELSLLDETTVFQIGTQQPDDLNPGDGFSLQDNSLSYRVKAEWDRALDSGGFLIYGVDLTRIDSTQEGYLSALPDDEAGVMEVEFGEREKFILDDRSILTGFSPYVGSDFALGNGWLMHAGVRLNRFRGGGFEDELTAPRLKIEHEPGASLRVFAEFGRQGQLPTAGERSSVSGNPTTLKLQKAEQSSLGVAWAPGRNWSLNADVWHKEFDGLVVKRDSFCDRCYENAGEGSASGLDVAWRYARAEAIGYISYGYIRTERLNSLNANEFPASGDQPHSLVFAWSQPFSEGSNWTWSVKAAVASGQPFTRIVGRKLCVETGLVGGELIEVEVYCPVYGELNGDRLPTQLDVDLAFERRVPVGDGDGEYVFRLDLLNLSGLLYDNVTEYDYGTNFENYENPEGIDTALFVPNFAFEWRF